MISSGLRIALHQLMRKTNDNSVTSFSTSFRSMPSVISHLLLPLLLTVMSVSVSAAGSTSSDTLTLTTWNIEHLAEKSGTGCKPRSDKDYDALRDFAKGLQADVVALQEVESKAAVHRVFPRSSWNVVMSSRRNSKTYICRGSERRSTQQKVAIAIRKGVRFNKAPSLSRIGLGQPGLRHGVVVDLLDTKPKTRVLALHLKSGCFTNDYHSPNQNKSYQVKSCNTLQKQVPILLKWAKSELATSGRSVVMLGDFNHQLADSGNVLWRELTGVTSGSKETLTNAMAKKRGCHPRYPKPIDHILMGPLAYDDYVTNSVTVHYFGSPQTMTKQTMLSDHCPISIKLRK